MSKNLELQTRRNKKIKERYIKLSNKKIGDKQLYQHMAILEMLSNEFYLTPEWIERIVISTNTDTGDSQKQISMF